MSTVSFSGLLIISLIAVAAPILAASVKHVKLPSATSDAAATEIIQCRHRRPSQGATHPAWDAPWR